MISPSLNTEELRQIADEACSTTIRKPIIAQYYPGRQWLWRQWGGTVVRRVLPREVLLNICLAAVACLFFRAPGPQAAWRAELVESYLAGVGKVWSLTAGLVTFTLSFFLSQSYGLWRSAYSLTRRVQGRLNDVGLLCAAFAKRDETSRSYTSEAEAVLSTCSRYVRLFNMLFYASISTRFAPLKTPQGLSVLVEAGALTSEEREGLLESHRGVAADTHGSAKFSETDK